MANQYPLPSGYPPPGATYSMNQSPPVVQMEQYPQMQQYPAGYHQPPMNTYNPGPQSPNSGMAGQGPYFPPAANPSPVTNPQFPEASYAPAYIPEGGSQGSGALPYAMRPVGQTAERAPAVNTNPHVYDDPILRAEMEAAAAAQAAAASQPMTPPAMAPLRPVAAEVKAAVVAAIDSRPFFLVSEHNEKCVLDVFKDNPKPGAAVGIYKKKTPASPNQLWYIGEDGLLRSKLSDMVISAKGSNKELHTAELSGDVRQQWIIEGNRIINKMFVGECVTVKKGLVRVKDDAEVIAAPYEGKPTQHWKQVYMNE